MIYLPPWNGPLWWFVISGLIVGVVLFEVIAIIVWLVRR